MDNKKLTILHVEDDPLLASLVRSAFENFGFAGAMITSESIRAARDLLNRREIENKPLSLIISDIGFPDGSGLDLIRELKTNPYWRMTPVIVLSGEGDYDVINTAYVLGANSYLPKDNGDINIVASLESFYKCWLENVLLPRNASRNQVREALDRATGLRVRTSEFYLGLARGAGKESEMKFWLDRALVEGNLSNLLAFFRDKLDKQDFPPEVLDRVAVCQVRVADALIEAEDNLKNTPAPEAELVYGWVIDLADAIDEEVLIQALLCLLPRNPIVGEALRARAAAQFRALAQHILDNSRHEETRRKAASLLNRSSRIAEAAA